MLEVVNLGAAETVTHQCENALNVFNLFLSSVWVQETFKVL